MSDYSSHTIDVEGIVRARAGKRRIPHFLIRWLKSFVHQDFINEFLRRGYEGVDFCEECMKYLDVSVTVEGMENLDGFPADARFTFASNHPLGGIDGVTLGAVFGRRFDGKVVYLVNDLLMNLKGLAPICVPVNKIGKQSRNLPQMIDGAFSSDNQVIIFPAGLCSRKIDGKISDLAWGKSFVRKSVETGRYIVPVHFIGENSPRFYRVAKLCKLFNLKFNFAMLFLPDELYKAQHGHFTVKIGNPIAPEVFDKSRSAHRWAQWVREEVYNL